MLSFLLMIKVIDARYLHDHYFVNDESLSLVTCVLPWYNVEVMYCIVTFTTTMLVKYECLLIGVEYCPLQSAFNSDKIQNTKTSI